MPVKSLPRAQLPLCSHGSYAFVCLIMPETHMANVQTELAGPPGRTPFAAHWSHIQIIACRAFQCFAWSQTSEAGYTGVGDPDLPAHHAVLRRALVLLLHTLLHGHMPDSQFDLQKIISAGITPIMQDWVKEGSKSADLHELGLAMLQWLARGQLVTGLSELDPGWWLSASSLFTKMHTIWQLFGKALNAVSILQNHLSTAAATADCLLDAVLTGMMKLVSGVGFAALLPSCEKMQLRSLCLYKSCPVTGFLLRTWQSCCEKTETEKFMLFSDHSRSLLWWQP